MVLDRRAAELGTVSQNDTPKTTITEFSSVGLSSVLELIDRLDKKDATLEMQRIQALDKLRRQLLREIQEKEETLSRTVMELWRICGGRTSTRYFCRPFGSRNSHSAIQTSKRHTLGRLDGYSRTAG